MELFIHTYLYYSFIYIVFMYKYFLFMFTRPFLAIPQCVFFSSSSTSFSSTSSSSILLGVPIWRKSGCLCKVWGDVCYFLLFLGAYSSVSAPCHHGSGRLTGSTEPRAYKVVSNSLFNMIWIRFRSQLAPYTELTCLICYFLPSHWQIFKCVQLNNLFMAANPGLGTSRARKLTWRANTNIYTIIHLDPAR